MLTTHASMSASAELARYLDSAEAHYAAWGTVPPPPPLPQTALQAPPHPTLRAPPLPPGALPAEAVSWAQSDLEAHGIIWPYASTARAGPLNAQLRPHQPQSLNALAQLDRYDALLAECARDMQLDATGLGPCEAPATSSAVHAHSGVRAPAEDDAAASCEPAAASAGAAGATAGEASSEMPGADGTLVRRADQLRRKVRERAAALRGRVASPAVVV